MMLGKSKIKVNNSIEGETIEQKIERIILNGEPISDTADIIYTDRKDGVLPAFDIRTDKMDIAIDAMNKVSESRRLQRAAYLEKRDNPENKPDGSQ